MNFKNFTKKLRTGLFVLLVFSLFTFFHVPNAFACSCMPASVEGALSGSDAVFAGKVTKIQYLDDPQQASPEPRTIVTFDVSQWWKGSNEKQAVLHTVHNTFTCNGYWFKDNEEYLVYASKQDDGTLGTSFCKRTNTLVQATEDLSKLGKGTPPTNDVQPPTPKAVPSSSSKEIVFGIIALAVIGVIYKVLASRKGISKS